MREIYVETYKTSNNLRKFCGKMFKFGWKGSCFTENLLENVYGSVISPYFSLPSIPWLLR